ncbi:MAG: hypothetical protein ACRD6W_03850 [Nitrososphaerales archaeon]
MKVSKQTARQLSALQHSLRARSIEETINLLVRKHRKELLDDALGADRGRVGRFKEEDRGEDRS